MMYIYIATIVVMLGLILFTSFAILTISKTTCQNIKKKTLELASLYDYLLEEHSQELKNKKRLIEQMQYESVEEQESKANIVVNQMEQTNIVSPMATVENLGKASYLNSQVADVYQEIRASFDMDLETVLERIPEMEKDNTIGAATKLLSGLSYETMYAMSFLTQEEQEACMRESLDEENQTMLESFMEEKEAFSSLDFYSYLKELEEKENTKAKIFVSPNVVVNSSNGLQVEVRDDICEGIQVEMNHMLYDFAVEKKEIGWVCQH